MESSTKRLIIISASIIILMILTIVTIPEVMSPWWLLFAAFTSIAAVGGILQIIATVKNEQKKEKKKEKTSQPPPGKEIIPSKLPEISKMIKECPIVQRSEVMKKYFQGKEVKWSGKIYDVKISEKTTEISIHYNLYYSFVAIFSGNKDKRLELLKGGEKITVRGEIDKFIDSVYHLMILKNCEIISLQR